MLKPILLLFVLFYLLKPSVQDCNNLSSEFDYLKFNYVKKGTCPAVKVAQCFVKPEDKCQGDYDCPGIQKCCKEICGGLVCQEPFFKLAKKPGSCPKLPSGVMVKCQDPSTFKNECKKDSDCSGFKKCCSNLCGFLLCESKIDI